MDGNEPVWAMLLNKKPCAYVQKDKCAKRGLFAAQMQSPNLFGFGRFNATLKVAPGQSVRTTMSVYGSGTTIGITFEGSKGKQVDLQVGHQYHSAQLPFDSQLGYHSYGWLWTKNSVEFYVEGKTVWTVTTDVPSKEAPMIVNIYPCGASYCPKYTGRTDVQSNFKSLAFQPAGRKAPDCSPKTWKQTWQDEFNGNKLGDAWTAFNNCTHGPTERELYVKDMVEVKGGKLILKAEVKNAIGPKGKKYEIVSGWVDTSTDFSYCHSDNPKGWAQLYGKFEVNARIPKGQYWPAIWFMNNDKHCWPTGGEIDLMEPALWSGKPPYSFRSTYHYGPKCNDNHSESTEWPVCHDHANCTFAEEFHTWTLVWNPNSLQWWLDGTWLGSVTQTSTGGSLPYAPHYFILNNAVNKKQAGPAKGDPGLFEVDWIKVYQYSHF
eukprot:TRINITY_DN113852_c0_g1_i1.p1 TRINITY_DN113852_c0_g1~~TRINITY_DN113852_c0_g1_i1.p1  ORF type:complete len:498 (+),score=38.02 TRINITY_DN113852_c0_g1_i1:194-1495(+)